MIRGEYFDIFKQPFWYDEDGQQIFDRDDNLVLDLRGWGILEKLEHGEQIQNIFGRLICSLLDKIAGNELVYYLSEEQFNQLVILIPDIVNRNSERDLLSEISHQRIQE